MHNCFCFLLFSVCCTFANAQYAGYTAVNDRPAFEAVFTPAAQHTKSIQCDFVQEKNLSMLSEKIVSKGKFWFRKNNMVRMEYTSPFKYLMIINNDKVFVKDGEKQNSISTKSNKLFKQINQIMLDCVQGRIPDNKDFIVQIYKSSTNYLMEMTPAAKNLKDYFKKVNVFVDRKDLSVSMIEMTEPGGDNTIIRFSNKVLNTSIPDALFNFK